MNKTELRKIWKKEEDAAHIKGWDFSHIYGRYEEEMDLPWDYKRLIEQYINKDMCILDYDTGGGEFLLSLNHPYEKTSATEGYQPNVELCKEILLSLGIDFKACDNPANIPFQDASFDLIINRNGDFNADEIYRLLTLTVNQLCIGIFSLTALAFIAGGMNVIYRVEQIPLLVAILIHGSVLYVSYLATYLLNDWLELGMTPIFVFTVIFVLGYLVIWIIIYVIIKR